MRMPSLIGGKAIQRKIQEIEEQKGNNSPSEDILRLEKMMGHLSDSEFCTGLENCPHIKTLKKENARLRKRIRKLEKG